MEISVIEYYVQLLWSDLSPFLYIDTPAPFHCWNHSSWQPGQCLKIQSPLEQSVRGTNPPLLPINKLLYKMVYWMICGGCLRINTQIPKVHPLQVETYIKQAIHIKQKIRPFLQLFLTCVLSSSTLPASPLWLGTPWFLFGAARGAGWIFGTVTQKQKLFFQQHSTLLVKQTWYNSEILQIFQRLPNGSFVHFLNPYFLH